MILASPNCMHLDRVYCTYIPLYGCAVSETTSACEWKRCKHSHSTCAFLFSTSPTSTSLSPPRPLLLITEHGCRGVWDSVWRDRPGCHRIPNRKRYPRHHPHRQFLYFDPSKIAILTPYTCLQAMSEKQDILALLQENQEEMDLLAQLYNEHKERLDQTKLTQDLERLRAYACFHCA